MLIGRKDHITVRKYLKDLIPDQLLQLGLALGLYYPTVKETALDDLIHSWLIRQDGVIEKSGEPTFNSLAGALEEIEQNGLASDVRQQKFAK